MKRMCPLDSRFMLSTSSNNNLAENLLHFFTSLLGCHDNSILKIEEEMLKKTADFAQLFSKGFLKAPNMPFS